MEALMSSNLALRLQDYKLQALDGAAQQSKLLL